MRPLFRALVVAAVITAWPALAATDLERVLAKIPHKTGNLSAVNTFRTFCVCDDGGPTSSHSVGLVLVGVSGPSDTEPLKRIVAVCQPLGFADAPARQPRSKRTDALVELSQPCASWFPLSR